MLYFRFHSSGTLLSFSFSLWQVSSQLLKLICPGECLFLRAQLRFLPGRFSYCETVYINTIHVYICVYTFQWLTTVWWSQTVLFSSGRAQQFIMLVSSLTQICHKILWILNVLNVYVCVYVHTYINTHAHIYSTCINTHIQIYTR